MRFGILGWPVAHSRSPAMFAAIEVPYQLLPVPPELFDETARALGPAGFRGANVTMPHKAAALALADTATDHARAIGAANTLTFGEDGIAADNTDAPGLIGSLPWSPAQKTALVLGAGGSARGVVWALLDAGALEVRIWNRTPARAEEIALDLGATPTTSIGSADILVNCTSVGLDDPSSTFKELPLDPDSLGEFACAVDLVYRPGGTALLHAASAQGCDVVDGLEILVRQGALSYEAWTGRAPDLAAMRQGAYGDVPPTRPHDTRR
jgi:shikimate dehydrogenase